MSENQIKKIGKLIKSSRKKQGLTQEELAGMSGVGIRFVRELEHGKASCHISKVFDVLIMLGLDINIGGENL